MKLSMMRSDTVKMDQASMTGFEIVEKIHPGSVNES